MKDYQIIDDSIDYCQPLLNSWSKEFMIEIISVDFYTMDHERCVSILLTRERRY